MKIKWLVTAVISAALVLILMITSGVDLYTDWLWFKTLGKDQVFLISLTSDWGLRAVLFIILFVVFFTNLLLTRKSVLRPDMTLVGDNVISFKTYLIQRFLTPRRLLWLYAIIAFILAAFFSSLASGQWLMVQSYLHKSSFGISDPILGKDVGFYVFELPFYRYVYSLAVLALVVSGLLVTMVYFVANPGDFYYFQLGKPAPFKLHLSVLVALLLGLKAWGYRLAIYDLLRSPRGVTFGASYTDVYAHLPSLKILSLLALVAAIVIIINVFTRNIRLVVGSIILLLAGSVLLGNVYPALVQKFKVEPDEFAVEEPFLKHNIRFTRSAYNLDQMEEKTFPVMNDLSWEDIQKNRETLDNIRLWDWRPLQETYKQLQELRLYYDFENVDVDRYTVNGKYRQVMLAAREMNQEQLPGRAKTWVNRRLRYTHGYGLVMSPVNEVSPEGLPNFFIKDIPPRATSDDLNVVRPEIYYGELTNEYVVVGTKTEEFDYPWGDSNVDTRYEGEGGVPLSSLWRRLVYAWKLGDYKLLLSGSLTSESRIMYVRNIHDRVRKVFPYLLYDPDPYLVVSNGRLYWIQDAYTVTDMYPYSEPVPNLGNYIRNSVKVVIDAYNGQVEYYIVDSSDPIAKTYSSIFPGLFRTLEEMPADLRNHMRYPELLFRIQAEVLTSYHMTNPRVFYNKEDVWNIPQEIFAGKSQEMEPYYTIMKLPGSERPEFVLMLPFTPSKKNNMVAWLAARSDQPNYGKLILFKFPKDKRVFGPLQIEARIDQDSEISQQLTLWNQRGSQTIRGNLLVLPIENSILYVEPLFLQAEESKLPEFKRVIVVFEEKVVMAETLEEALRRLFGQEQVVPPERPELSKKPEEEPVALPLQEMVQKALQLFNQAQDRLRAGDWAGYGEFLKELEDTLQQMARQVE
ncbi:UPF0182 family protein [Calderihabitans maritimus]|uniref:UPF0182 protein KKC1_06170 n=1 Tax=Calderihabitans maritimus TaxID=1246530 RepID=A0A1Z5HQ77_9FIRM|nr:UPF0182 family protein [Calderihabitans maritimus]GAW91455.1 hypothetical protein PTH_1387 [Calderihabitans maritimus]